MFFVPLSHYQVVSLCLLNIFEIVYVFKKYDQYEINYNPKTAFIFVFVSFFQLVLENWRIRLEVKKKLINGCCDKRQIGFCFQIR